MSKEKTIAKKTVKINENDLVDLIDGILTEAVEVKKKEWLNEQATKKTNNITVLEGRIGALETKLKALTEGKK